MRPGAVSDSCTRSPCPTLFQGEVLNLTASGYAMGVDIHSRLPFFFWIETQEGRMDGGGAGRRQGVGQNAKLKRRKRGTGSGKGCFWEELG